MYIFRRCSRSAATGRSCVWMIKVHPAGGCDALPPGSNGGRHIRVFVNLDAADHHRRPDANRRLVWFLKRGGRRLSSHV
ncbi:hypothetical protein SORBI_3004G022950 [Sorghum bicolor]|uniref:Uncharacterized protein n=1 Tax=Sorghum bicolor TaxID=4558 RepID=A0A1Z5RL15_SORBI|nr:hypothetical protein SORBI_3004G022950 [Sorghum bicolor]